jgi:hypothetical protein
MLPMGRLPRSIVPFIHAHCGRGKPDRNLSIQSAHPAHPLVSPWRKADNRTPDPPWPTAAIKSLGRDNLRFSVRSRRVNSSPPYGVNLPATPARQQRRLSPSFGGNPPLGGSANPAPILETGCLIVVRPVVSNARTLLTRRAQGKLDLPRPSVNSKATSQFSQHFRDVCALPAERRPFQSTLSRPPICQAPRAVPH